MTENEDRQLLAKAAKAAGISGKWGRERYIGGHEGFIPSGAASAWNPLADDGDALRLAVKLELSIGRGDCTCCVVVYSRTQDEPLAEERFRHFGWNDETGPVCERHDDEYAATRRAIVRAAASIAEAGSAGGGVEK